MPVSRRSFLLSASGLVTAAFVEDALACLAETGRPLLLTPTRPSGTLHCSFTRFAPSGQLAFGCGLPPEPFPTWLEFRRWVGQRLDTEADIARLLEREPWLEGRLHQTIDFGLWPRRWSYVYGPFARAFDALRGLDLGPRAGTAGSRGLVDFQVRRFGGQEVWRWASIPDPLSASLLQARLRELDLPLAVTVTKG